MVMKHSLHAPTITDRRRDSFQNWLTKILLLSPSFFLPNKKVLYLVLVRGNNWLANKSNLSTYLVVYHRPLSYHVVSHHLLSSLVISSASQTFLLLNTLEKRERNNKGKVKRQKKRENQHRQERQRRTKVTRQE